MNDQQGTIFRCVSCSAPLEGAQPGLAIRCGFCNTEQLVESDSDSVPPSAGPGAVDFDRLHEELSSDPVEWHDRVWESAFALDEWRVLVFPSTDEPVQADVDGDTWLFVCTDNTHAQAVAAELGVLDGTSNATVVAMTPEQALEWMLAWAGGAVHGVRFNDDGNGWTATFDELARLKDTFIGDEEQDDDELLEDDQALAVLRKHLKDAAVDYEAETLTVELDEDNTDDERVYVYVKDEEDEVLDYFFVDRELRSLHVYDYDEDEWNDASA